MKMGTIAYFCQSRFITFAKYEIKPTTNDQTLIKFRRIWSHFKLTESMLGISTVLEKIN